MNAGRAARFPQNIDAQPSAPNHCTLSVPCSSRGSIAIQFTSQLFPPSSENDCSKRHEAAWLMVKPATLSEKRSRRWRKQQHFGLFLGKLR